MKLAVLLFVAAVLLANNAVADTFGNSHFGDELFKLTAKKRPVRLTAKQAPHRPGISRGALFARQKR
jgi:hypothetical protein